MSARDFLYERATTVVASGAATSKLWLPPLDDVSGFAADILPILGVVWLLMQMLAWLFKRRK